MQAAQILRQGTETVATEFERFARTRPAAGALSPDDLRDHIKDLLSAIAADIEATQSGDDQRQKSEGRMPDHAPNITEFAHRHAATRVQQGFTLPEMVSEYRAMRASITRVLMDEKIDASDFVRMNESLDQALVESICWYTGLVERGRDMFLAVFSHDLRNPLNAASMCAEILLADEHLGSDSTVAAVRVRNSVKRMSRMIEDLLDFTRTRLGQRLPTNKSRMDMAAVVERTVDELRAVHPGREIRLQGVEQVWGDWDGERIIQMLGNLVGNAVQHGDPGEAVTVSMRIGDDVQLTVHNMGPVIAPEFLDKIFDPLVRGIVQEAERRSNQPSVGLGLYISREIARAHGGDVSVSSSADTGTTFTVRLMR